MQILVLEVNSSITLFNLSDKNGSLKFENLYRLEIESGKVIEQELIFSTGSRVRDVETGPDGFIYVAIEDPGRIIRLKPIKN